MKALTFEEWYKKVQIDRISSLRIFDLARQGMIPEDEAVRIPPVKEWPVWAEEVRVFFSNAKDSDGYCGEFILRITRPTHAWTPKVGDKIFYQIDTVVGEAVAVGIVSDVDANGYCAVNGKNDTHYKKRKPFDASKIGKPWEEI